jgi:hypothetical protein
MDRLPGLQDSKAHERQLQFVAQVAQRIEDDALFPPARHENVMDLVQDQDLHAEVAKKADCRPLQLDDCRARFCGAPTTARICA